MSSLSAQLEAILFYKGEPIKIEYLSTILNENGEKITEQLHQLEEQLQGRGLALIWLDDKVSLATSPETGSLIESLLKQELEKDLGKAGLETLAIILYQGPITRSHVDYIRGVNSTFIIRQLLIRGLVERIENPSDGRAFLYKPTIALLSFLGLRHIEDLPQYSEVRKELEQFKTETVPAEIEILDPYNETDSSTKTAGETQENFETPSKNTPVSGE